MEKVEKIVVTNEAVMDSKKGNHTLLIKQTEGFLNSWANQYLSKINCFDKSVTFNDLVADGIIGIVKAAKKYDPEKGTFLTYARHYVDLYMYFSKLGRTDTTPLSDRHDVEDTSVENESNFTFKTTLYNNLLSKLNDRSKDIVKLRCEDKLSYDEIGKIYNLTGMRISEIYKEALNVLRPIASQSIEKNYIQKNMITSF